MRREKQKASAVERLQRVRQRPTEGVGERRPQATRENQADCARMEAATACVRGV